MNRRDGTLTDDRRAQLSRYVPWLARDYLMNQGPSTALVVALVAYLAIQGARAAGPSLDSVPGEVLERVLRQLVSTLVYLGTVFATNGMIANDRKQGFYKFLFSKPVSPPSYYATTFLVYGVGLLFVTAVLLGLWSLAVRPMWPPALLPVVALMYLAYGGIGFLLSAAWRFDWVSLVSALLASNVAWGLWGATDGVMSWLVRLLPPVHRADGVYDLLLAGHGAVPWVSLGWLGGYGLACFLLGFAVIRRRPLGTS